MADGSRPSFSLAPRPLRITRAIEENERTMTFFFDASIEASPGQFVMVWLPGLDEKPFSLAADDPLAIAVARVGPFSTVLQRLGEGERIWIRGPFGNGFAVEAGRALLVGGGYGAAPLLFLARRLAKAGSTVVAVLGGKSGGDLLFTRLFREAGADIILATEDGSCGMIGLATEAAEAVLRNNGTDTLYACGPEGMLSKLESLCVQYHIRGQLCHEAYMRCGIGVCGSCERDGLLVCADGPVFRIG